MMIRLLVFLFVLVAGTVSGRTVPARAGQALSPEARRVLAGASDLVEAGKYSQAIGRIQEYVASAKGDAPPEAYLLLGGAYYQSGKLPEALRAFQAGRGTFPDNESLCRNTGIVLYELERYGEAGEMLQTAYGLRSGPDPALLFRAASAYYAGDRFADAASAADKLLSEGGRPEKAWVELAVYAHFRARRFDRARALLLRCLAMDPENPVFWELAAKLHADLEEYGKAAAALEIRSRLASPSARDLDFLSEVYRHAGAPGLAAETLERKEPAASSAENAVKIAALYVNAGRIDAATDLLDLFPGHAGCLLYKARLLFDSRRFKEAESLFRKSLEAGASEQEVRFYLGLCAWERCDWHEAHRAFSLVAGTVKYKDRATGFLAVLDDLEAARGEIPDAESVAPGPTADGVGEAF